MTNLFSDVRAIEIGFEDFVERYGDQELIALFKRWLDRNMGGDWVIAREARSGALKSKLDLLQSIHTDVEELDLNAVDANLINRIIIKHLMELKHDLFTD